MNKNIYKLLKRFYAKFLELKYLNIIECEYDNNIEKFIDVLYNSKDILYINDAIINDFKICLIQEYRNKNIDKIIEVKYFSGSYGSSDYDYILYDTFNTIFKFLYMNNSFDDTCHQMLLLKYTHFGAIDDYLTDYIIFKNLIYNPNKNIKYKIAYIRRIYNKNKASVFVKIDRQNKKKYDRNEISSYKLNF